MKRYKVYRAGFPDYCQTFDIEDDACRYCRIAAAQDGALWLVWDYACKMYIYRYGG